MGFLDSAKAAAEQAVTKAKEAAGELQTKRELGQAYDELGRTTFDLVESGQVRGGDTARAACRAGSHAQSSPRGGRSGRRGRLRRAGEIGECTGFAAVVSPLFLNSPIE